MVDPKAAICTCMDSPITVGQEAAVLDTYLWPNGKTLTVGFLDGAAEYQQRVRQYLPEWSQYANLHFSFDADPSTADVRVSFDPPSTPPRVFNSLIGTTAASAPPGEPTLHLGFTPDLQEWQYKMYVLHEFGHAIGLIHEHQSPGSGIKWDEAAVYQFYRTRVGWDDTTTYNNVITKYGQEGISNSTFDPVSIMLYSIPPGLTLDGFQSDWNRDLSDTDKAFIGKTYPLDAAKPTALATDGKPVQGSLAAAGQIDLYRIDVTASGRYVIETQGSLALAMTLFRSGNEANPEGFDDGSGVDLNARIDRDLAPGTYVARVQNQLPESTGLYSITARRGD